MRDVPLRQGYAEAKAVWTPRSVLARGEVGWKPREGFSVFGYGEHSSREGPSLGVGARWDW